jgi:ssDNA-binding Zn-finger/Zn-ribbon topoisomerase 1
MFSILVVLGVIGIIVLGTIVVLRLEKEDWNGGICKDCGTPWVRFDTDSGGGRLYKCKCPDNFIAISWWFDDKYEKKKA